MDVSSKSGDGPLHIITCAEDVAGIKMPKGRTTHLLGNEFVLGGVLRQEVDIESNTIGSDGAAAAADVVGQPPLNCLITLRFAFVSYNDHESESLSR